MTKAAVTFPAGGVCRCDLLARSSGRSLTLLVWRDRLNAATRRRSCVTFRRQAGEHGRRAAASLQQAAQGQGHARFGHVPSVGGSRLDASLAFTLAGLQAALRDGGAVQGHADGGWTRRGVGQEREGGRGTGRRGVDDSRIDREVRDRGGKSTEL